MATNFTPQTPQFLFGQVPTAQPTVISTPQQFGTISTQDALDVFAAADADGDQNMDILELFEHIDGIYVRLGVLTDPDVGFVQDPGPQIDALRRELTVSRVLYKNFFTFNQQADNNLKSMTTEDITIAAARDGNADDISVTDAGSTNGFPPAPPTNPNPTPDPNPNPYGLPGNLGGLFAPLMQLMNLLLSLLGQWAPPAQTQPPAQVGTTGIGAYYNPFGVL